VRGRGASCIGKDLLHAFIRDKVDACADRISNCRVSSIFVRLHRCANSLRKCKWKPE
jgi:hypothetical protein